MLLDNEIQVNTNEAQAVVLDQISVGCSTSMVSIGCGTCHLLKMPWAVEPWDI
jgi:hypothetical protein